MNEGGQGSAGRGSAGRPRPFAYSSGPHRAKVVIVGEAWGETEAEYQRPFCGASGKELWRMLGEATLGGELHAKALHAVHNTKEFLSRREAWLEANEVLITNTFALHPQGGKIETLCHPANARGSGYPWPQLSTGNYIDQKYAGEISRLHEEILHAEPNLIICLGNVASWAVTQKTTISALRGNTLLSVPMGPQERQFKTIITYHPSAILQNWSFRTIALADLIKAWRDRQFSEIRRPQRAIIINPQLGEIIRWVDETLAGAKHWPILAPDIETSNGQITCIGFARSPGEAIVIPFWHKGRPGWNYWGSMTEELCAWGEVERLLRGPQVKVFQNGLYDLQYITRMGIVPQGCLEDTMLLHHSLLPEMQKGLGFLGSIYTDESSWKLMRQRKTDTEKHDE